MSGSNVVIMGRRHSGQNYSFTVPRDQIDFCQEDLDLLIDKGREIAEHFKNIHVNGLEDFGEDALLIKMTEYCINEFGGTNPLLLHIAYRFVDNELENCSKFHTVYFDY